MKSNPWKKACLTSIRMDYEKSIANYTIEKMKF